VKAKCIDFPPQPETFFQPGNILIMDFAYDRELMLELTLTRSDLVESQPASHTDAPCQLNEILRDLVRTSYFIGCERVREALIGADAVDLSPVGTVGVILGVVKKKPLVVLGLISLEI
jgi:hypothetical protein